MEVVKKFLESANYCADLKKNIMNYICEERLDAKLVSVLFYRITYLISSQVIIFMYSFSLCCRDTSPQEHLNIFFLRLFFYNQEIHLIAN